MRGTLDVFNAMGVVYRVKSGHHFGETVLTGRRRIATCVEILIHAVSSARWADGGGHSDPQVRRGHLV